VFVSEVFVETILTIEEFSLFEMIFFVAITNLFSLLHWKGADFAYVCVCVCAREREREREGECVCLRERERGRVCL